ncbi:hypothetical protein [Planococcus salinarum]|uniref:hypothetical protein n=1 Tax=Planococcus salinarum TaxID=622695 RepID=UPI000E3C48B1|nr:hypothetical protein [Planococcus salinarum]TAA73283.1 hypothetical protein D2909_00085 [Planococcus salinarum]
MFTVNSKTFSVLSIFITLMAGAASWGGLFIEGLYCVMDSTYVRVFCFTDCIVEKYKGRIISG